MGSTDEIPKFATIIVELNCHEHGFGTGDEAPASLWFIPRRVEIYVEFDSLKAKTTHVVGPIALRIVNGIASSLLEAFRQMDITVEEFTVSDD